MKRELRNQLSERQESLQVPVEKYIRASTKETVSLSAYNDVADAIGQLSTLIHLLGHDIRRNLGYRLSVYTAWKLIMSEKFDKDLFHRMGGTEFARAVLSTLDEHDDVPKSVRDLQQKVATLI